jgi:hypothetical protein
MTKKTKKPARGRAPNDYLSLSRSDPGRLAGSSGELKACLTHLGLLAEKGRAGGRARLPARPVAVSRSRVCETAVACGVDSCKVSRACSAWFHSSVVFSVLFLASFPMRARKANSMPEQRQPGNTIARRIESFMRVRHKYGKNLGLTPPSPMMNPVDSHFMEFARSGPGSSRIYAATPNKPTIGRQSVKVL